MSVSMSFVNMKRNPSIESYATQKIQQKIERMIEEAVNTRISFIRDHGEDIVKLNVRGQGALQLTLSHSAGSMSESIDRLSDRLKTLLQRRKRRDRSSIRYSFFKRDDTPDEDDNPDS